MIVMYDFTLKSHPVLQVYVNYEFIIHSLKYTKDTEAKQ